MTVKQFRDKVKKNGVLDLHAFLGERSWYILNDNVVVKGNLGRQLSKTELKAVGSMEKPLNLTIGDAAPIFLNGSILNFK